LEGYNKFNEPIITAKRQQIPLILCWAMTIHKSQGQTIERLRVDLSKCFMNGQIYTALSRVSNPKYLQIINFPLNRLWCSGKVRDYYKELTAFSKKISSSNSELNV
jgi:ATP-dependent DNA helicase PIF1